MDKEQIIGVTTSGAFGHTVYQSLAFAYVQPQYADPGTQFEIKILEKCKSEKSEIIESIKSSGKLEEEIEKQLAELIKDLKLSFK